MLLAHEVEVPDAVVRPQGVKKRKMERAAEKEEEPGSLRCYVGRMGTSVLVLASLFFA